MIIEHETLLGILIPHFNDERIILLLDRINETSYRSNIKIFIQDAGSEKSLIAKINDRLKKNDSLIIAKDEGIFDGFNKLLERVDTKYVTWLGADDLIDYRFNYDEIYKLMISEVDYIQCKLIYFNSKHSITRIINSYSVNYYKALFGIPFYHIGSILKSSIVKENTFSLEYPTAADFFYYLKILNLYKLKSTPCNNSIVFIAEGGASGKSISARIQGLFQMLKFYNGCKILIIPIFLIVRFYFKMKSLLIRDRSYYFILFLYAF